MRGRGGGYSEKQETCLLAWFLPSRGAEESFFFFFEQLAAETGDKSHGFMTGL